MIAFTNNTIIITGETVSTESIYQACVTANLNWVQKLGSSMYRITKNLYVGHKDKPNDFAKYIDKNVFVQFEGNLFQVYKGSEFRIGTKRDNGSTTDGCVFNMPLLTLEYGFGYGANAVSTSRDPQNAGNFFAYNSTINAYCFWAWFAGVNQKVELIDCSIDGFGRVEGSTSIIKNVTIKEAHNLYGMLTPKGQLAIYENINVGQTKGLTDSNVEGVAFYFNPLFSQEIVVTGGTLKGYEKLMYTESNPQNTIATCTFIDTNFEGTLDRITEDAKSRVLFKYTFKPKCLLSNGAVISGVNVKIKDKTGTIVFDGNSDIDGFITTTLTKYKHEGVSTNPIVGMNPYTIISTYNDPVKGPIVNTKVFNIYARTVDFPLYVDNIIQSTQTDGGCSCDDINVKIDSTSSLIEAKLEDIHLDLRQIMLNVITEINENQTIIEQKDGSRLIL